jgi:hypothetical protein
MLKRNRWKEMTDGDVSFSSKRLDTYTKEVGWISFLSELCFFCFIFSVFAFIQMFTSLPVGPHPPNG